VHVLLLILSLWTGQLSAVNIKITILFPWPSTLGARGFSLLERRNAAKRREKSLVQAVEFFENACPMGCRFIFPESDFDSNNSIGSRNMSVLTSTLIGLATESSSNSFSILLSTLFPVATGHNRNPSKSWKSRFWWQKKFSGFYSFSYTSAKIRLRNLASKISNLRFFLIFYMEHWIFEFDIKVNKTNVPWEPKMLIGRLCHASNYSFFRCQSNGAWKWGSQRPVPEVFPLRFRRSEREKPPAARVMAIIKAINVWQPV